MLKQMQNGTLIKELTYVLQAGKILKAYLHR